MRIPLLLLSMMFLCSLALPAFAQEMSEDEVDFSQATDSQFKESQAFFDKCIDNETMNLQYDCRCLSAEYLAERMNLGDSADESAIMDNIRTLCVRGPNDPLPKGGNKMKKYSDEELDEAQAVYAACQSAQVMSTYMDCKCVAASFIDKRHELGPLKSTDEVLLHFRDTCKNATGIAGKKYTECMEGSYIAVPSGVEPRPYCECKANKYVELYMKDTGRVSAKLKARVDMQSSTFCRQKFTGRAY